MFPSVEFTFNSLVNSKYALFIVCIFILIHFVSRALQVPFECGGARQHLDLTKMSIHSKNEPTMQKV
jgi:hypothetical protein